MNILLLSSYKTRNSAVSTFSIGQLLRILVSFLTCLLFKVINLSSLLEKLFLCSVPLTCFQIPLMRQYPVWTVIFCTKCSNPDTDKPARL